MAFYPTSIALNDDVDVVIVRPKAVADIASELTHHLSLTHFCPSM
jgi:hypothetical protein